ncbi:NAD(P)-dependent oxidoreductase [Altibacter sp. HG106]|uniref:NAD(P)-dependent oxidoreductase n=1 Tax=Altibacter sp. HG106 TaxID=3023937 RepID=UPI002350369F|nr:NAD(P)-dependent oxidoreductase [Altibacter sp. HG106]MDC7996152.1 NAD(P)-dependent oxidoreductase [Altibacter sp. HG106]
MTFALIKERKNPPDRRVVFSPQACQEVMEAFPEARIIAEHSDIRVFPDQAYQIAGVPVLEDVSEASVMLGVKEVPPSALIPKKKYFFFSHTIKKQPYNRGLLQEILKKKIELYDHETIVKANGGRLIGFGRYAGLVGAYNGFRALGFRQQTFILPKAENLPDLRAMKQALNDITLPPLKIVLTGSGKVAKGAKEILEHLKIQKVAVEAFLNEEFTTPVYCHIDVLDYNKRSDGAPGSRKEFYKDPSGYESDFMRFAKAGDMLITGHFYGQGAPYLFTREDVKDSAFNLKLVADITCDIDGPIACTVRPSTIAEPFYGYDPTTEKETAFDAPGAITVMAVDNLPCELPKDASEGFGEMFMEAVLPAFFNDDKEGILERAKMTTAEGTLTQRFSYLQDYVDGIE